ncbi:MAG: DUF4878 domain-containing protein [Desulfitobacterium hafniense]|nr:DUF4878 domain-containing protein [Desulfitobacterium hafniense]
MKKHTYAITGLLVLTLLLGGCAQSVSTTSKPTLTPEAAAQIIMNDLTFHREPVVKITVTGVTISADGKSAVVEANYTTKDGLEHKAKPTLKKSSNTWKIVGHEH